MKSLYSRIILIASAIVLLFAIPTRQAKGEVLSFTRSPQGVTFKLDRGAMKILLFRPDLIEVKYTVLDQWEERPSLVVLPSLKSQCPYKLSENNREIVITTSRLKIKVNKTTQAIQYTDLKDQSILSESVNQGKAMIPVAVAGINTWSCSTQFSSPKDEALYGLGCHPEDTLPINYKGRNQTLAIKYLTGAIPVLLSTRGYGLMWDNYSASAFYGAEENNSAYRYESESGKMVDYYFFYGPDFDHIIDRYRQATGTAPLFGKWAYGLFQSQDRYQSQAEVLSVKDRYRNNHIPVDCIVQDWFYWEPNVIGSHVMDPGRYPNPKQMVDELHQAHLHAMISIWPVMAKGTNNWEEMNRAGLLTDITWQNVMTKTFDNYYDAHSEKARQTYWRQAKEQLIAPMGWDAWWVDQCEPDNGALLDERRRSHFATGLGIDYFNTYSLMHSTGLYDNWRKEIPGKRAFFLIRQAFAGQQRNSAALWSSDITCTFRAFKSQVPQAINTGASGIPYWTSDIGGYHFKWSSPKWSTPANRELFTRWFQFGVFSPIFRIHGKGERALYSDNWDAPTKAILLSYDRLRYRLLPYIYSLAWRVTHENYTLMRSLAFDFRTDPAVRNIPDQYMFGPALLVNPVTEPINTSKTANAATPKTRPVYLPGPDHWFDFWTGKSWSGGQTIDAAAPIETIPLFVRAGSIIPMGPTMEYATEKAADPIELRIYAGANGRFTLYEDENDTYHYEQGIYATIPMEWNDKRRTLTLQQRQGSFPGMLTKRQFRIVLVKENHGIGGEITEQADKTVVYNGTLQQVKF